MVIIDIARKYGINMNGGLSDNFDQDYTAIKELVKLAKEAEEEQKYKEAKLRFLDAASATLDLAKISEGVEELTFRNIARMLVDTAKEMQILLEMEKNPLPSIPGKKIKTMEEPVKLEKKNDPVLQQLMIIQSSGLPVFTWTASKLSEMTKSKINDILFSGAITAVNSLISEVLSKPIQAIQFEDGNILLKFHDEIIFVVYAQGDHTLLEDNISAFSKEFIGDLYPRMETDISKGLSMNNDPDLLNLVEKCFKI